MIQRIGFGYDIHRFKAGRRLFLGGVEIPFEKGLEGHSDADVLLHAICDSILGALCKGDIGEHFPNSDDKYKNISSTILLSKVKDIMTSAGFSVVNVDCTVIAEEPVIKNFKNDMKKHIASKLNIDVNQINIKATTQEQMGAIGRKEGIAALASVLITKY